jgi:cobalt/nickel transport protein
MVGPHVLAGIMEGLISMLLLALIHKISPGFLAISSSNEEETKYKNVKPEIKKIIVLLLTLALIIGVFVSPFASRKPKGLEKLAIDHGFAGFYERIYYNAPFPNYSIPYVKNRITGHLISGLMGVIVTFLLCLGTGIFLTSEAKTDKVEANLAEVLSP